MVPYTQPKIADLCCDMLLPPPPISCQVVLTLDTFSWQTDNGLKPIYILWLLGNKGSPSTSLPQGYTLCSVKNKSSCKANLDITKPKGARLYACIRHAAAKGKGDRSEKAPLGLIIATIVATVNQVCKIIPTVKPQNWWASLTSSATQIVRLLSSINCLRACRHERHCDSAGHASSNWPMHAKSTIHVFVCQRQ